MKYMVTGEISPGESSDLTSLIQLRWGKIPLGNLSMRVKEKPSATKVFREYCGMVSYRPVFKRISS